MLLLALETVTRAGSLAICETEADCTHAIGDPHISHGVRLPAELLQFIEARGQSLDQVDAFVVVTGPGSFTGLRVGLATIQGLALAGHKPVIGVPTLDAMINGWMVRRPAADGSLMACLDGARGDVFYTVVDVTGAATFKDARVQIEPSVATPDAAAARIRTLETCRSLTMIGDGAERYRAIFGAGLTHATLERPMPNLAEGAARLALAEHMTAVAPHALRPVYIRRPDAELARDRSMADGEFTIAPIIDAAGREEIAALQARVFHESWKVDDVAGGDANREIARVQAARDRSGRLVGYVIGWLVVDQLHIHSVAVDPHSQRRGVAKALMERMLAEARASGATSATLEVRESNGAARALYERIGFVTEAVRPAYYQNPTENALILWRRKL